MHILLLLGVQVIVLCHAIEGTGVYRYDNIKYDNLMDIKYDQEKVQAFSRILEEHDKNDLRSIADIWMSIKNSAKNAWSHVKNMANNAKDKIKILIQKLKDKSEQIQEEFKQRMKNLQEKMYTFIEKAKQAGQIVKKCLKDEKESIDNILKEIISNVTACISINTMRVSILQRQLPIDLDETEFINSIEDKINACIDKEDIDEGCLYEVRENMLKDIEELEEKVFKNRLESRTIVDDILNKIVACSTEGIISASTNITMEAIKIAQCVSDNGPSTVASEFY